MEKAGVSSTTRRLRSDTKSKHHAETIAEDIFEETLDDGFEHCNEVEYPRNKCLENGLVMDNIFRFFKFEDIKHFRLVCRKWNDASRPFVEKMFTVVLGPAGIKTAANERSSTTFNDLVKNSGITFQAFKLTTLPIPSAKWSIADLVGFLEDQKQNILKLSISKIRLRSNPDPDNCFSLDPYISNHLKDLALDNSGSLSTTFAVSSDKLTSKESLFFKGCTIHFVKNCKLRPTKLEILDFKAMENGKRIKAFSMDDYIRFDKIQDLILAPKWGHTELSLNMATGNITLRNLVLDSVKVENLASCKWKIRGEFKLRKVAFDFERRSQMQFKELDFGGANINLAALPESIEELILERGSWAEMDIICSTMSTSLPNLKYLELLTAASGSRAIRRQNDRIKKSENLYSCLSFLTECQNLKTLKLVSWAPQGREQPNHFLDTNWIPPTVENIYLSGRIRAEGPPVQIKKLLIDSIHVKYSELNLTSPTESSRLLKSDQLILDFDSIMNVADVEEMILTLIRVPYKSLAFGPLDKTKRSAFNKSRFSKHVDKISSHYLFTNKTGNSITEQQFKKLVDQHHDN